MAENKENHISIDNIPYEILYQIVSLIPLKEAARTIILSSSWKHLWAPVQVFVNMDFDRITTQESGQQMNQLISSFLNTYETSYQILNLSFLEPKTVSEETLFFKAIKGVDKELHICFNGETPTDFGLTIELPLCKNAHFCSLKTLHLRSITSLAGSFLPELFSSCWNLETLTLEKCSGLQNIDLKAHGFLQKFVVLDCENMENVTILSAPNLKSFCYRGTLVKTELEDVPALCDVTLDFKGSTALRDHSEFDSEDIVSLLASLKDVEVLTVSGWLLEWLCTRGVIFDDFDFMFNELKELSWIDCCMNKQKRDSLVCFLSITPSLENLFIKIDKKWSTKPCSHFHQSCPQAWTNEATTSSDWNLKHMKVVKFLGFKIEEQNRMLVSLIDVLLKKAIVMKKMSVTEPENKLSWSVAKVPRSHLNKMEKASTTTCHPSKSSLLLSSLDNNCCFRLTPTSENEIVPRFLVGLQTTRHHPRYGLATPLPNLR
ncbi:F-box protein At2g39490 [Lactuca sativa]|uniref:F-box protein At2g39490 n=1 Tax=Lactuca sativa TaxID=4236 RepID=UPI000CD992B2|nr:F-box protein At2g39490 [Lactuca sativa]